MSGLSHRSAAETETTPSLEEQAAPAIEGESNDAAQEELRGKTGTEVGRESYEGALGKWLGSKLYEAIAPHLTMESLSGYANDGFTAALEESVGLLGKLDGEIDEGAIDKFGKALSEKYDKLAGSWLEKNGSGLVGGLGDWVDTHPKLIVLIGLLAAAGAIAADMDIPALKQKFKITDELTASVEAQLGSLRNVALEQIKARLEFHSGPLMLATQVEHSEKDGTSGTIEAAVGDDDRKLSADIKVTEDGIEAYGVHGLYNIDEDTSVKADATQAKDKKPVISAQISDVNGNVTTTNKVNYDTNSGVLKFEQGNVAKLDNGDSISTNVSADSGGNQSASVGAQKKIDDENTLGATFTHTETSEDGEITSDDAIKLSFRHKDPKLEAALGLDASTSGTGKATGSLDYKPDEHWKLGANAEGTWGGEDGPTLKLGGYASYANGLDKFYGSYSFESLDNKNKLTLMGQKGLTDEFAVRGMANFDLSDDNQQMDLSLHGAYFVSDDVALIGGGSMRTDFDGNTTFIPQVGAEVKGVPILIGYDTVNKGVTVGITIPFGGK